MTKIDWLLEAIVVEVSIECSKCGDIEGQNNGDEYYFRDYIERLGWTATQNNIYCPICSKRYLKSKK